MLNAIKTPISIIYIRKMKRSIRIHIGVIRLSEFFYLNALRKTKEDFVVGKSTPTIVAIYRIIHVEILSVCQIFFIRTNNIIGEDM